MSPVNDKAEGATPLDPDEREGLKYKHVTTRGEVDELEQANIETGLAWLSRRRKTDILTKQFVRELHRGAHLEKKLQALLDAQPVIVAVLEDIRPVHVLHRVERMTLRRDPSVDQPRDVLVLEPCESLSFALEADEDVVVCDRALDDLDRDLLLELVIAARGEVDLAHSTDAENARDRVRADRPTDLVAFDRTAEQVADRRAVDFEGHEARKDMREAWMIVSVRDSGQMHESEEHRDLQAAHSCKHQTNR